MVDSSVPNADSPWPEPGGARRGTVNLGLKDLTLPIMAYDKWYKRFRRTLLYSNAVTHVPDAKFETFVCIGIFSYFRRQDFRQCNKKQRVSYLLVSVTELTTTGVMARGQMLSSVCDFACFWIEVSHNMFLHEGEIWRTWWCDICLFFFRTHLPSLRPVLANTPTAILDS